MGHPTARSTQRVWHEAAAARFAADGHARLPAGSGAHEGGASGHLVRRGIQLHLGLMEGGKEGGLVALDHHQ